MNVLAKEGVDRSTGDIVPSRGGSGYFGRLALVEVYLIIYRHMRDVIVSLKSPTLSL